MSDNTASNNTIMRKWQFGNDV